MRRVFADPLASPDVEKEGFAREERHSLEDVGLLRKCICCTVKRISRRS